MSQASISPQSNPETCGLKRALPHLRTLIDMLLATGGLFLAIGPMACLFTFPTNVNLAIFLAGCWVSFIAAAAMIFSTARSNQLAHRQTAFVCIAVIMLFYAGVAVFVSRTLPHTAVMIAVSQITMGAAVWGLVCCGLISCERRLVTKLKMQEAFTSSLGVVPTLRRVAYLPLGFFLGLNFIFLPILMVRLATAGSDYLPETLGLSDRLPTSAESISLYAIAIWMLLIKCGFAAYFWALLIRFHDGKQNSACTLTNILPERWQQFHALLLSIGVMGFVALAIIFNTTTFGLASAPWILTAMIFCVTVGCWRFRKSASVNA